MFQPKFSTLIQCTLCCAALATSFSAVCTYMERVVVHTDRLGQHVKLLNSDVCSQPSLRLATSAINGCDEAHRVVTAFSPQLHALIDLLETMSPCGAHAGTCEHVAATIWENVHRVTFMALILLFSSAWLLLKKHEIDSCTATRLPLDSGHNPLVPFFCKKRD